MATMLAFTGDELKRPWLAIVLVMMAFAVTLAHTTWLRSDPLRLLRPVPVGVELAVGAALVLGDGVAFGPGHAFSTSQSLGSVWPLAGVLAAGAALGPLPAAGAGVVLGCCRIGGVLLNGVAIDTGGKVLSLTSTIVFYALGGAAAGYVARLLRRAEREISAARAREEVARTLHDGVLQTLAVVERRTEDPALARLAREQERELRDYLFGMASPATQGGVTELTMALRACASRFEDAFGGRAEVFVADDSPPLSPDGVAALAGAVGEALVNAGKHGRARKVVVYVEPDEAGGVFCSVRDDGEGFDPATTPQGVGLSRSIRGRMEEAGGRVEVISQPGEGAEVCLWLP